MFIAGMENGLFPHSRSFDEPLEMQEERRLCYVGMTRAERWLFLTGALATAAVRYRTATDAIHVPGGRTRDLPDQSHAAARGRQSCRAAPPNCQSPVAAPRRVRPQPSAPAGAFAEGRIVQHQQFGRGVIQKCEGEGEALKLTIVFSDYGVKKIMPKYASMQVV